MYCITTSLRMWYVGRFSIHLRKSFHELLLFNGLVQLQCAQGLGVTISKRLIPFPLFLCFVHDHVKLGDLARLPRLHRVKPLWMRNCTLLWPEPIEATRSTNTGQH